jgi:hypothetical protein
VAGKSKDQKEAAVITPAESPSIAPMVRPSDSEKKKTSAAPAAVIAHMKSEAEKAAATGETDEKISSIKSPL